MHPAQHVDMSDVSPCLIRLGSRHSRPRKPRATGKGRDEIREILVAELNARGLKKPSDTVLDAIVDRISGNPLPAVRLAAESLVQVSKGIHELSRRFRSGG
jgi:hypothetical protein